MTAQASFINRMRTGDIRSIPLVFWAMLGLAGFAVFVLIRERGLSLELADAPSIFLRVGPFLLAAAVALAAPADRRFLWGALALCASEAWFLLRFFEPASGEPTLFGVALESLGSALWALTLAGLLLIGVAVGGIRSRFGWLVLAIGALVFVVSAAWQVISYASIPTDQLFLILSPEQFVVGVIGHAVIIGWAYLLGAGLDNNRHYLAVGAGLMLGQAAFGVMRLLFLPVTPDADFTLLNLMSLTVSVAAWSALIAAAMTEFGPRRLTPADDSGEPNANAEAAA